MTADPASTQAASPSSPELEQALALFRCSLLKQDKLRQITRVLGPTAGLTCLDIGANNGVLSWLLRARGGLWHSADLEEATVASIRALVGERVERIGDRDLPYADAQFDRVVIIDALEHLADDRAFMAEMGRIIKPGGALVVNVPHLKPGSLLNRLRHGLGLTDELHGHLRPGYDQDGLQRLLPPGFVLESARTYSKVFSEAIDTALSLMYLALQKRKGRQVGSAKGIVLHQEDRQQNRKELLLMQALYPLFWLVSRLDWLLPFASGYKLVIKARHVPGQGA
jgi:SAM-dependent methyltransferase